MEQAECLQNIPSEGNGAVTSKWKKKDWIRGGGSRLQSGIQYHGVLSDDFIQMCLEYQRP